MIYSCSSTFYFGSGLKIKFILISKFGLQYDNYKVAARKIIVIIYTHHKTIPETLFVTYFLEISMRMYSFNDIDAKIYYFIICIDYCVSA